MITNRNSWNSKTENISCTELAYIENFSLNDTPRSEVHNMFDTILYVMNILPGLDNTIMIIRVITS